ncbi:MAG: hypothetical protein LIP15_23530, partial [Clostridium sp.]|nr:hypothetical protein [Clostridium sp.]
MANDIFWNSYLNLEDDLLEIAKTVHVDDKQLDVYSMRIADMLVTTCVQIESLAKRVFFANGGTAPTG